METGPFPHVSTRNLVLEAANLGKIYNEVATPLKNLAEYYARLSSANHSSFIYLLIIFVFFFFLLDWLDPFGSIVAPCPWFNFNRKHWNQIHLTIRLSVAMTQHIFLEDSRRQVLWTLWRFPWRLWRQEPISGFFWGRWFTIPRPF